jgi:hypothetical protein
MDIAMILHKIRPSSAWSLKENKYETLDWKDSIPKPTYEEIVEAWDRVQEELDKENVERLRRAAYQKEADPLFFEFQRGDSTEQEWLDKIAEIKARYPYSGNSQA